MFQRCEAREFPNRSNKYEERQNNFHRWFWTCQGVHWSRHQQTHTLQVSILTLLTLRSFFFWEKCRFLKAKPWRFSIVYILFFSSSGLRFKLKNLSLYSSSEWLEGWGWPGGNIFLPLGLVAFAHIAFDVLYSNICVIIRRVLHWL